MSAQIMSTKGFIEQEKKRLVATEEAVIVAVQNRDECLEALEELQLQEKSPFTCPVDAESETPSVHHVDDWRVASLDLAA